MASTLYIWETESRYKESFVAAFQDVEEAFTYARALIRFAEQKCTLTEEEKKDLSNHRL